MFSFNGVENVTYVIYKFVVLYLMMQILYDIVFVAQVLEPVSI